MLNAICVLAEAQKQMALSITMVINMMDEENKVLLVLQG